MVNKDESPWLARQRVAKIRQKSGSACAIAKTKNKRITIPIEQLQRWQNYTNIAPMIGLLVDRYCSKPPSTITDNH
jgi:hypothetical protein